MKLEDLQQQGVYFHTTGDTFCYTVNNLACGLSRLGVPVRANIGYTDPRVSHFEFRMDENVQEPAMVLIDLREGTFQADMPYQVNSPQSNTHIFAICDSVEALNYQAPYPLYRAHSNRFIAKSYTSFPEAFGVSDKLKEYSDQFRFPDKREEVVIRNFRPSGNQFLRLSLDLALLPVIENHLSVDRRLTSPGNRWDTTHLEWLGQSLMCLAYGGTYYEDISDIRAEQLEKSDPRYDFLANKRFFRSPAIVRWDSWRFWESLMMGCLAIQLDFEKYGFELPVVPQNWVHYVGLSLDNLKADFERLMDERHRIPEIAAAGRQWAIEHYSADALTRRFLANAQVALPDNG